MSSIEVKVNIKKTKFMLFLTALAVLGSNEPRKKGIYRDWGEKNETGPEIA